MGLDMFLNKLPRVSKEKLKEFNRRLTLASFDDSEKKEIKKIEGELGYKLPTRTYDFIDVEKLKKNYHEYQTLIATSTNTIEVKQAEKELDEMLTGWGRTSVGEEAMYWRKSNHIHNWFVENVQNDVDDCGYYEVTIDQLNHLISDIEAVLKDKDSADDILPTQGGFFFGSTDYDEWYFDDLKETRTKLKRLRTHLKRQGDNYKLEYHASW